MTSSSAPPNSAGTPAEASSSSLGKHAGIHGDYRYTFLDFNDDDDEEIDIGGALGRVLPGHKGSMWTVGVTVYF